MCIAILRRFERRRFATERLEPFFEDEEGFFGVNTQDFVCNGEEGRADRLTSDRLTATRGGRGDYALVYSANGRRPRLRMERLARPMMAACWFNPRNGRWHVEGHEYARPTPFRLAVPSGAGVPAQEFTPPSQGGDGNDWVLVLREVGGGG
jgi:hypothetical protein